MRIADGSCHGLIFQLVVDQVRVKSCAATKRTWRQQKFGTGLSPLTRIRVRPLRPVCGSQVELKDKLVGGLNLEFRLGLGCILAVMWPQVRARFGIAWWSPPEFRDGS